MEACKSAECIGDSILQIILVEIELFELGETSDGFRNLPREEVASEVCAQEKMRSREEVW